MVRQKSDFSIEFEAVDAEGPEGSPLREARHILELSPHQMVLAGVGTCTSIILLTYAQNHGLKLDEVEIEMEYREGTVPPCEGCAEKAAEVTETVNMAFRFEGHLTAEEREKLLVISGRCPVHRMLEKGIPIHSELAVDIPPGLPVVPPGRG